LWIPIPCMATHTKTNYLAPNFNWLMKQIEITRKTLNSHV
jgi:hypothetical protein